MNHSFNAVDKMEELTISWILHCHLNISLQTALQHTFHTSQLALSIRETQHTWYSATILEFPGKHLEKCSFIVSFAYKKICKTTYKYYFILQLNKMTQMQGYF